MIRNEPRAASSTPIPYDLDPPPLAQLDALIADIRALTSMEVDSAEIGLPGRSLHGEEQTQLDQDAPQGSLFSRLVSAHTAFPLASPRI